MVPISLKEQDQCGRMMGTWEERKEVIPTGGFQALKKKAGFDYCCYTMITEVDLLSFFVHFPICGSLISPGHKQKKALQLKQLLSRHMLQETQL